VLGVIEGRSPKGVAKPELIAKRHWVSGETSGISGKRIPNKDAAIRGAI